MSDNERISLGKGLSELLGANKMPDTSQYVKYVMMDHIFKNPYQPRTNFQEEAVKQLAESITQQGILTPIIVRTIPGGKYQIIAGERRFMAAKLAQLSEVPVIIKDVDDKEAHKIAMIENIQRENLNAIEEALGYKRFINEYGYTHNEVSEKVGKSRSYISNMLRILDLPDPIIASLAEGKISVGHAKILVGVPNATEIANKIVEQDLSVRQVEKLLKQSSIKAPKEKDYTSLKEHVADDFKSLQELIETALGLKVRFKINDDKTGDIVIRYSSLEELDKVLQVLSR